MPLTWKRMPRKAFMPSHWIGTDEVGRECFHILQRARPGTSRHSRERVAELFRLGAGCVGTFPNVGAAKDAAQNDAYHDRPAATSGAIIPGMSRRIPRNP
jgi:hypothetical protein